jgi:hypothetical protein
MLSVKEAREKMRAPPYQMEEVAAARFVVVSVVEHGPEDLPCTADVRPHSPCAACCFVAVPVDACEQFLLTGCCCFASCRRRHFAEVHNDDDRLLCEFDRKVILNSSLTREAAGAARLAERQQKQRRDDDREEQEHERVQKKHRRELEELAAAASLQAMKSNAGFATVMAHRFCGFDTAEVTAAQQQLQLPATPPLPLVAPPRVTLPGATLPPVCVGVDPRTLIRKKGPPVDDVD